MQQNTVCSLQEGLSLFLYSPERFKESLLRVYLPLGYKTLSIALIFFQNSSFSFMFTAYGNAVNAQSIQVSLTAIMSRTTNEHNNEITFGLSLKLKLCQLSISPGMSGTV